MSVELPEARMRNAETQRPVAAVRSEFVGIVCNSYRGEFGDVVAKAIKQAAGGHAGEAFAS